MEIFWMAAGIGVMFFFMFAGIALLEWVEKYYEKRGD